VLAPKCKACLHAKACEINQALAHGDSERLIAAKYRLSQKGVNRHRAHIAPQLAEVRVERARTLADDLSVIKGRVGEVFAKLDEVPNGEPCKLCGATPFTPAQALDSGFLEMKLKASDRLAKLAELEHGTKAKVAMTVDWRQEWAAMAPAEKRERIAEMKHRILELEAEVGAEGMH
jgi:hypothetical protein